MRLKSLSNKELIDALQWALVDVRTRELEPRYETQTKKEQTTEYHELHAVYQKYWDEAARRKLVEGETKKN